MSTYNCFTFEDEDCSDGIGIGYCYVFPFQEYSAEYVQVAFTASATLGEDWLRIYYQTPGRELRQYPDIYANSPFPLGADENPLIVRTDNFEIRRIYADACESPANPLDGTEGLITVVQANDRPQGSTKLLLRVVDYPNAAEFTYGDAGVSGFAVSSSGLVTPPTAAEGTIRRLDYSIGYTASINSYPTSSTTNVSRSVDVTIKVPNNPEYTNARRLVSGSEFTIQSAAPTLNTGSWATSVNSNNGHIFGQILTGTTTAALLTGFGKSGTTETNTVESFNGVSWTNEAAYSFYTNNYSDYAAVGTQTDTTLYGGLDTTNPFSGGGTVLSSAHNFNGTSWSTLSATMNKAKAQYNAAGTTSDTLLVAGGDLTGELNDVQEYNGTTFSTTTNYPDPTIYNTAFGNSSTTTVSAGGDPTGGSETKANYTFDGITWSANNDMVKGRSNAAGFGNSTDGIVAGGEGEGTNKEAQNFNGFTWGTVQSVPFSPTQPYQDPGGAGTTSAGFYSISDGSPFPQYNRHYIFS